MKTISNDVLAGIVELEKKTILGRVCRELLAVRKNPTGITIPELPVKPVKPVYRWRESRLRDCDHCGTPQQTVFTADEQTICAGCADQSHQTAMEGYADELLSVIVGIQAQIAEAASEPV